MRSCHHIVRGSAAAAAAFTCPSFSVLCWPAAPPPPLWPPPSSARCSCARLLMPQPPRRAARAAPPAAPAPRPRRRARPRRAVRAAKQAQRQTSVSRWKAFRSSRLSSSNSSWLCHDGARAHAPGRDVGRRARVAVCVVGAAEQLRTLADGHACDRNVPGANDLSLPNLEGEGSTVVAAARRARAGRARRQRSGQQEQRSAWASRGRAYQTPCRPTGGPRSALRTGRARQARATGCSAAGRALSATHSSALGRAAPAGAACSTRFSTPPSPLRSSMLRHAWRSVCAEAVAVSAADCRVVRENRLC